MPKIEKTKYGARFKAYGPRRGFIFSRPVVFWILGNLGILAHFRHSLHHVRMSLRQKITSTHFAGQE